MGEDDISSKSVEHFGEIWSEKEWDEYVEALMETPADGYRAEVKTRMVHGRFWRYDLVTTTVPRKLLKRSQYLERLKAWAREHDYQIVRIENYKTGRGVAPAAPVSPPARVSPSAVVSPAAPVSPEILPGEPD